MQRLTMKRVRPGRPSWENEENAAGKAFWGMRRMRRGRHSWGDEENAAGKIFWESWKESGREEIADKEVGKWESYGKCCPIRFW